ncbi:sensor histidine kinase [Pseudoflavitalea rhizosphaerae]|uniref:sensor histidine kinase n=1 Tax=Pseudoflavitalea rhizosphaerae TaxID=1884793 RepID=UPI0013DF8115|nr:sensor histidine kinase [Pseudoflavitalea rhizosphaerae]
MAAQQNDAAIKLALSQPADSSKLSELLALSDSSLKKNEVNTGLQALQVGRVFLQKSTVEKRSQFYWLFAELLYKQKKYSMMEQYTDSLLAIVEHGTDRQWYVKALHQKAAANIHRAQLTDAAVFVNKAIDISKAIGDQFLEARGYQIMGQIAFQGRQIPEVKKQYARAIAIFESLGKEEAAAMLSCSMSRTFVAESSIYLDTAFNWNNKAKQIAAKYPMNLELQYFIWQNEADYYARGGDFKKADQAFEKAEQVAKQMPSHYSLGGLLQVRSYALFNAGKMEESLKYAHQSKDVFIEMGDFPMLKKSYQLLYTINEEKGDYKSAYEALNEYVDISDSIFNQQSMAQINDLNVKYETSEKERIIAGQELTITRKNANTRMLLISLVSVAAILCLSLFLYFQRRKVYRQSLVALKREQDISLLKALMTGEEKERNRLARELHDGLGGILAAAQMHMSNAQKSDAPSANKSNEMVADLISKAAVESRRIAHNLLPETLLRFGLEEALQKYCESVSGSKMLNLEFQSVGLQERLEQSVELSIYRIVQELVNNIIRHAGASEALVQLHRDKNRLSITVEDDGKGFAPSKKEGIGLSNVASRVSYLNGSLDIRSDNEKGTSVFIEIQLEKNEGNG